jgi:branched-chain amino acid aminotransferase
MTHHGAQRWDGMAWTARILIQNGRPVPIEAARLHPFAAGLACGATVFETLAANIDPRTHRLWVFRLEEHLARLDRGMRFMRFDDPPARDTLRRGVIDAIAANTPDGDCYIRLQVHIESPGGLEATGRVGWVCAAVPRARSAARLAGLAAGVSSWTRSADSTMPARIKAAANYHAARIAMLQARADGYDLPILLTREGKVSETSVAALMLVRDGVLVAPPPSADTLESITRDTLLTLAREDGLAVCERAVDRSELVAAQEVLVCGTGHEVTPVTSIDRLPVGDGRPGPVTRHLAAAHEAVLRGTEDRHAAWRTPVA